MFILLQTQFDLEMISWNSKMTFNSQFEKIGEYFAFIYYLFRDKY